jgi:hypothetical protein
MLLALVEQKKATYLGQRYNERGVKQIAVEVQTDASPNEQVRLPRDFFTTALSDYADWREKWFRECIQNSVDGGATRIDIVVDEKPDGVFVSCEDNGRGMDRDVLLNKFLVPGATTKTGVGGSTGGFGKAKELLVWAWLSWSVHTRDAIVDGSGTEYEVKDAPFLRGTKISVVMPLDQTTSAAAAQAFIGKCHLPGIRFTVNGTEAKAGLRKGEEIIDFDGKAILCHNKKAEGSYWGLLVRANGLYMFDTRITRGVPGALILELTKPSIDLLTANRDGFRDTGLRHSVEDFITVLAKDTTSALDKKKGLFRERFRGTGKFEVTTRELNAALLENEGTLLPESKTLSKEQVEKLVDLLDYVENKSEDGSSPSPVFRANGDLAKAMLDDLTMKGPTHVEAAIAQLAWKPDFYLINEIEGFRIPRTLRPEKMATRTKQLITYWAELCRFVLIQLGSASTYGVGFIISETKAAAHVQEDGEDWLVLNPFKKRPRAKSSWEEGEAGEFYSLSDKDDLAWLYAAAVHECTHIADGFRQHDEYFSSAFTVNVAKTSGKLKQLTAIRKAVVARQQKRTEAAGEPKVKPKVKPKMHNYIVSRNNQTGRMGGALGEVQASSADAAVDLFNRENPGQGATGAREWDDADDGLWWVHPYDVIEDTTFHMVMASNQSEAADKLDTSAEVIPVWPLDMDVWGVEGGSRYDVVASSLPKSKLIDKLHRGKGTYKAWLHDGGEPVFVRKLATAKGMAKRAEGLLE